MHAAQITSINQGYTFRKSGALISCASNNPQVAIVVQERRRRTRSCDCPKGMRSKNLELQGTSFGCEVFSKNKQPLWQGEARSEETQTTSNQSQRDLHQICHPTSNMPRQVSYIKSGLPKNNCASSMLQCFAFVGWMFCRRTPSGSQVLADRIVLQTKALEKGREEKVGSPSVDPSSRICTHCAVFPCL